MTFNWFDGRPKQKTAILSLKNNSRSNAPEEVRLTRQSAWRTAKAKAALAAKLARESVAEEAFRG
jgi:hypothetical protein